MFKNPFSKSKDNPSPTSGKPNSPQVDALLKAIAEKKKDDPLIGIKIGSQEILNRMAGAIKNEKGTHIESMLTAVAALGGFACQMALRETNIKTGKLTEQQLFNVMQTKDGKCYFFGDNLNKPLAQTQYSIWSLVGGALETTGKDLIDMQDIFAHSVKTVGTEEFGIPRVDQQKHRAMDTPQNYVRNLWPVVIPLINPFCDNNPAQWPVLFGMTLHKIIVQGKDVLDPKISATISMETAVAMSKIDPASVDIKI